HDKQTGHSHSLRPEPSCLERIPAGEVACTSGKPDPTLRTFPGIASIQNQSSTLSGLVAHYPHPQRRYSTVLRAMAIRANVEYLQLRERLRCIASIVIPPHRLCSSIGPDRPGSEGSR